MRSATSPRCSIGTRLSLLVLVLCGLGAAASAHDLVVPNTFVATVADFSNSLPLETNTASSLRYQQVYDAGEFPFAGPITIDSIAFRPWAGHFAAQATLLDLEIWLSTTERAPNVMFTTFALNVGADAALVFDDTIALSVSAPAGGAPHPFDVVIPLETPFAYDPAHGNLLLDIRNWTPQSPAFANLDQTFQTTDSTSHVFTSTGSNPQTASAPVGFAGAGGVVTRFGVAAQHTFAPAAFATAEAPGNNVLPFGTAGAASLRYQQVYDATLLPFDGGITIHSIAFRPDETASPATKPLDLVVRLSTTSAEPDALSATFDANVGPDGLLTFADVIQLTTAVTPPGAGPKDFDIVIPLAVPFHYDPAQGNLLLDLRNMTAGFFAFTDLVGTSGDGVSRVVTQTFQTASSPTGLADTGGLVTRFGLPEPSAAALGLAAALALAMRGRLRHLREVGHPGGDTTCP